MDNDIVLAQKIVGRTYLNLSSNSTFHEHSFIYKSTNEELSNINKYFKNKNNILTVISSGDQIINSILEGALNIDAFDISSFPKYFLFLKMAAIKKLSREEYIDFFFESTTTEEKYDDLYDLIRKDLNKENKEFWDSLFDYFDWYDIYNSRLFSSEFKSRSFIENENIYLEENNYNKLKNTIDRVNFNLYTGDILKLDTLYNKEYDIIYLSNIIDYVDKIKYKELLNKFNLKERKFILTYLYEINENTRNFFFENNYSFDNFENTKAGVMIYKK